MSDLRLFIEIKGFDRVLYEAPANWENFTLSIVDNGAAIIETWDSGIESIDKLRSSTISLKEKVKRFILCIEWAYGCELKCKILKISAPSFATENNLLEVTENLGMQDEVVHQVAPRSVPEAIPQVPLEAYRWIQTWVEAYKLNEYVEEQLRRQYLIIEELWNELHGIFDAQTKTDKKQVKLIRDFVSHASCDNKDIATLIENDLPSAVQVVNGTKRVAFQRTIEHRNYISRFEVKSREIARMLVDTKMRQFGSVFGV